MRTRRWRRGDPGPPGRPASLSVGDVCEIAQPASTIDAVVDFGIIHHVAQWQQAVAGCWIAGRSARSQSIRAKIVLNQTNSRKNLLVTDCMARDGSNSMSAAWCSSAQRAIAESIRGDIQRTEQKMTVLSVRNQRNPVQQLLGSL